MEIIELEWDHGRAEVQTLAAMLGPVHFKLDGREVQPFAVMPWGDDTGPEHGALPGILKRTRGEWPCVPFGAPAAPANLPDGWRGSSPLAIDPEFHGYSANTDWQVLGRSPHSVRLGIDYPDGHPIKRLERVVSGVPGQPTLRCQLLIEARRDVTLPIALHPCFALSEETGQTEIRADFEFGRVLPLETEPGVSQLVPDAQFSALNMIRAKDGTLGLNRLPLPFATEEIVQLCGGRGPLTLINHAAGYQVHIQYDQTVFPSVLLWVSNRGRREYPWLGRFQGVGIEPLCGAFDLGADIGAWPDNPIARNGVATAISLTAGKPVRTEYEFQVEPVS